MEFVDCRSDTVTKPTKEMRQAMSDSIVGDDVFSEDPTINQLEQRVAALFQKEAALFFPTGTMANLTAIMTWCNGRGEEAIVGDCSHIFIYEGGGAAHIGGVSLRTLPNQSDGTLLINQIVDSIRAANIHYPVTKLVALENTHNYCGGRVLPVGYIQEVANALKEFNIPLHIDGARIWHAAIATGQSLAELTQGVDSISVCMSKGLGAPVGSLLLGTSNFITKARKIRKTLGGGMRQVGVLGMACSVALDDYEANKIIYNDHIHAKRIGEELSKLPIYKIYLNHIESNILVVYVQDEYLIKGLKANEISRRLKEKGILSNDRNNNSLRIVTHRDLNDEDIEKIIDGYREVCNDLLKIYDVNGST